LAATLEEALAAIQEEQERQGTKEDQERQDAELAALIAVQEELNSPKRNVRARRATAISISRLTRGAKIEVYW
jgi:hypothetical protein